MLKYNYSKAQQRAFFLAKNIIYTTKTCKFCPALKKYLTYLGEEFESIDVTDDFEQREYLTNLTGMSTVPVLVRGDKWTVGYNPAEVKALVKGS